MSTDYFTYNPGVISGQLITPALYNDLVSATNSGFALVRTDVDDHETRIDTLETSASGVAASAAAAAASASAAATSASNASTSATNASNSASSAATQASSASSSATAAAASASSAASSASTASTQATNASTSASAAAASQSSASSSATAAASSATSASNSATSASTSASNASTSASNASTSASAASTSASNAATSATLASDWAQKTSGTVDGSGYSAKYWAQQAAATVTNQMILRGVIDASGAAYPSSPTAGDFYRISVAGTISGTVYAANDMAYYDGSSWRKIANEITAAANTFTGKQTYAASTTSAASINIPHGTAPTSPSNGDVWTTTSGLLARINGTTQTAAFLSANTFTGKQTFVASDTSNASINLPPGTAPTSPSNGDVWITSSSFFVRVNGATVDLGSGAIPTGGLVSYYDLNRSNVPSGYAFKGYGLVSSQDFFMPYIAQSNHTKCLVLGDDGYGYLFCYGGYRARYNFSTDAWDMPSGQSRTWTMNISQASSLTVGLPQIGLRFSGGNYFVITPNDAYTINESTYAATLAYAWPANTTAGQTPRRFCMLTDDLVLMANTTTTKTYNPSTGAVSNVTNLSAACNVCELSDGGAIALTTSTETKRWNAGRSSWTATGNHPFSGSNPDVAMCRLPTTGYIFGVVNSVCAIYDTGTDTWTTKTAPPASVGTQASCIVSGDKVLVTVGSSVNTTYVYSITGNSWSTTATTPLAISGNPMRYASGGGYVVGMCSNSSSTMITFTTNTSMTDWQGHGIPSSMTVPGTANLAYIGSNKFMFGTASTWYTYNCSTGAFTTLAAPPAGVAAIDMVWDGSNYVYGFASGGNGILYRYNISGDSWSTMATALDPSTNRAALLDSTHLLCFNSSANRAYGIYNISTNDYTSWVGFDDIGNGLVAYPISGVGVAAFGANPDGMIVDSSLNCYRADQQLGPASGLGTSTMTTTSTATSMITQTIGGNVHYYIISAGTSVLQRIFNLRLLMEKQ